MRRLDRGDRRDDRVGLVLGVLRRPGELQRHQSGGLVRRDQSGLPLAVRRLDGRDLVERADRLDHVVDDRLELRGLGAELRALDQDAFPGGSFEVLVEDLVGAPGLARSGGLVDDHVHRGDQAEREQRRHQPQPPEDGDLAVTAAPAGHSCGQVVMLRRLGHDSSFGT